MRILGLERYHSHFLLRLAFGILLSRIKHIYSVIKGSFYDVL